MLTPIDKLSPLTPISPEKNAQEAGSPVEESVFGAIFRSAIDNVKETDADFKEAQYLLATGQLDNPAMAMIAASKSQSAVSLLIQLRNKAQDAYSELMRISM
ncbi:MAG: flagellar hook-basal body complex protein FliE [Oscillibacter sp.]|jgi:flagellar hook-basal body complex protein FliE|nr:flagellar hook-basal body complex protein FliE [Oscillibacter sp.]MCI9001211.1 flagellar hook-basal body complex protein FliE [Oscillibacter sp.]